MFFGRPFDSSIVSTSDVVSVTALCVPTRHQTGTTATTMTIITSGLGHGPGAWTVCKALLMRFI